VDESTLPQNPLVAWVRTFQVRESLEELQVREWREEDGDDNWNGPETEVGSENIEEKEDAYVE
jgi:hypothetical protein